MNNKRKKGFTLVELVVVLVILGIIAAIAVPFFINYWKKAEFRKNEENAKTVYLAAESRLTYYRTSGQWESFKKEIKKAANNGESEIAQKAVFKEEKDSSLNGRIYTIKLNKEAKNQTEKNNLVLRLLDDYTYDKGFFEASVSIEIDIESGEVYSAFYGSRCKGLNYKDEDSDGYLTMQKRDYDSRSERLLGYYSAEDTVNTVNLEAKRLRITTISLVNSEKLSLEWSSNVGSDPGVDYEVSFYKNDDQSKLFMLRVSPFDMRQQGWSGESDSAAGMAALELTKADGTKEETGWQFPVTYSDNRYSVVLDAMMSAKVQAALDSQKDESAKTELEKSSSTSISRLATVAAALADPQNIYATVKATAYTGTSNIHVDQEYRDSEQVASNVANTMFGDKTDDAGGKIQVLAFRHLSNMRYYEKNHKASTQFTLANKNMDWASAGSGLYDFKEEKQADGTRIQKLTWHENTKDETASFPAISELPKNYTLTGNGVQTLVSNLYFDEESVADDATTEKLNISKSEFIGLFAELNGTVENVTFRDPSVKIGQKDENYSSGKCQSLKGIGALAGRSAGKITNVAITTTKQNDNTEKTTNIQIDASNVNVSRTESDMLGVGALVGVLADRDDQGNLTTLTTGKMEGLSVEGKMEVTLPKNAKQKDAYGIGGIVGYAKLSNDSGALQLKNCSNQADISGNMCVGGIVGKLEGEFNYDTDHAYSTSRLEKESNIWKCTNEGLILCTSKEKDSSTVEGNYFGGIVGYSSQALIYNVTSASGRAANFKYSNYVAQKENLLLGDYVGGIAGYGDYTLLSNCTTQKNGYVLGCQFVGGIAGGLGRLGTGASEAIQAAGDGGAAVTTNASYVIGKSYVGGIVGENFEGVTLKNCINNGVAAGYEDYVGGIVGYNQEKAVISDCASYLSDYDSSVYNMIVNQWKATADYAGGIAGYNNGIITFSDKSEAITVKSVSSIVVGQDYVGGIAGFQDTKAELNVHYTLIGGRIYAYGKCAGGAFGLNASTKVLEEQITMKPQSVQGKYYVGGCIGANVVDLQKNTAMSRMSTDNTLGRITGEAFCGGIIGYQRTYTQSQIERTFGTNDMKTVAGKLLPVLDGQGIPTAVATSENPYQLTVTTTNNIPIRAGLYTGGIIGYCEKNSHLLLKNCKNSGDIAQTASNWKNGVNLGSYISREVRSTGVTTDANQVRMHFAGGIIGVNLENQIIDHCANTGNMSGYSGTGGVTGLNAGLVYRCALNQHFGSAALNYIGGIAGVNIGTSGNTKKTYNSVSYTAGTIQNCTTAQNKTVSGNSNVGGIVGWNLNDGVLTGNTSYANISASGKSAVGGIAGRNHGNLIVSEESSQSAGVSRSVSAANAGGVGGLVGINENSGRIIVSENAGTGREIIAVNSEVSVNGYEKVGGIAGINRGTIGEGDSETSSNYLTCQANSVRASHGYAGGIAGETDGNIGFAVNRSATVTADAGVAGGITAVNKAGKTVEDCINYGDVSSSNGYAAGIVAENAGVIQNCLVKSSDTSKTATIYSRGAKEIGAVASVNTGTIENSKTDRNVLLSGEATVFGGLVGSNKGVVRMDGDQSEITIVPKIRSTKSDLTVGGVVGRNQKEAIVTGVQVKVGKETDSSIFTGFKDYRYLGGIVGDNLGTVSAVSFSGTITETSGSAGNCYGGIVGINQKNAVLQNCSIGEIHMSVQGVYTATSTSTAGQKESLATHAGGIAGKNEEGAVVEACTLEDRADSTFTAEYGMLGGIVGFNKGTILMSGSGVTSKVMEGADNLDTLIENAGSADRGNLKADTTYITWNNNAQDIKDLKYEGNKSSKSVSDGRLKMIMSSNGNIGGITAYNGTDGEVKQCVSGNWFLENKSEAIGVGTGGVIGMNESEKDLSYLVNGAFVGRKLNSGQTNRFAGGIIGNQNNSTSNDWTISDCVNYGTVYCYNTHYSGGIMGQWTGTGGNIEKCRNYGMLQTTFGTAWVGASAGIVAQLYHPYENHEYNIVGCGNYGSIYTKEGEKFDKECGANDSAGILGNVTTYTATSAEDSQKFTVQILDCVNAPGVKIYSGSMASGIFGFMSCDSPAKTEDVIVNSTTNALIRVERCTNYAQVLKGYQYNGGIFGARYGQKAWAENTIVKDNHSVNIPSDGTNNQGQKYGYGVAGYPIYSTGNKKGGTGDMAKENRKGNYHIEAIASNPEWGFTNVKIAENLADSKAGGSGSAENGYKEAQLNDKYTHNGFVMYDITKGQYFVAAINTRREDGKMTKVSGNSQYIDEDGFIVTADGTKTAEVLYYIDDNTGAYNNARIYSECIVDPENPLFLSTQNAWRRLEGIDKTTNKLLAPEHVEAKIADGKITIKITPQLLSKSWSGSQIDNETRCDPFMYRVKVTNGNTEKTYKIYSEEDSFNIPKELQDKNVKISVQAVSMYDDVADSDPVEIDENNINKVLPDPDVRVELVSKSGAAYGHTYRYVLKNLSEYNAVDSDGNAVYPGWQVKINIQGIGKITLNADHTTETMDAPYREDNAYTYQMTAQASITEGSASLIEASKEISVATELPGYRPSIALKQWTRLAQKVTVSGDTLDSLSVKVELDAGANRLNTPPIYRAELIGTWKAGTAEEQKDVVFAEEDILVVSAGKATATFTNLPEYLGQASDLRVRIWYAASGLGPVYTYYDVDADNIADANVKELAGISQDGTEQWKYLYSTVIENAKVGNEKYFENYQNVTEKQWDWLPAPELLGADTDTYMEPVTGEGGKLLYTFQWKEKGETTVAQNYEVSMTGIDASGREVQIDLKDAYKKGATTLTVDGTDWNYTKVKLKVTRVGDAGKKLIGLSATGTYNVKQRLEQPSQPTVENLDTNELVYHLSWEPIASEEGCSGYQAFIRAYDKNDKLGEESAIGNLITADQKQNGSYQEQIDLEKYAGKRVVIYLRAKASADSAYLDSVSGISYELEIPTRLEKPEVTWNTNWTHDTKAYVEAEKFENGGLTVSLKAKDDKSVPPGGSAYLLKAYIYDSADKAAKATETNPGDYVETYPADGSVIQMDAKNTHEYEHNLQNLSMQYAGKWIVFYARISSGSGNISSMWTKSNESYRLPYVKLQSPQVESEEVEDTFDAVVTMTPDVPGEHREWKAKRTVLKWKSMNCADFFGLTLKGTIADASAENGEKSLSTDIRIIETADGISVQAYRYVQVEKKKADGSTEKVGEWQWQTITENPNNYPANTPETAIHHVFDFDDYSVNINATYTSAIGNLTYALKLGTQLDVVKNEDGTYTYTLKLPDVVNMKAEDGSSVTHKNFNITDSAVLHTNVTDNVVDDKEVQRSDAYIRSDETKVEWKK